jgi:hypothetical protein
MYAGKNFDKAIQWAIANAKQTNTNRYLTGGSNSNFSIDKTPPKNLFGSSEYWEVRPDGTYEKKAS